MTVYTNIFMSVLVSGELSVHAPACCVTVPSHGRSTGMESMTQTPAADVIQGSQVVAVGTPLPSASLALGTQQGPVMVRDTVMPYGAFITILK